MKSAVFILGGGSPKNFILQTEPQIQEVMGVAEKGHDYFLQVTDARPDTGGLSGRDAVGGGELGQNRSRPPARLGGLLRRFHGRAAADHRLRAGAPQAAPTAPLYDEREAMMTRLRTAYERVRRKRLRRGES